MGSPTIQSEILPARPASLARIKIDAGLWVVLALFLASRVAYVLIGQKFDIQFAAVYGMHVLSPDLLLHDLWRSLFYLHGQPPVFNLLNALILRLSPGDESAGFQITYWICGVILAVSLYTILKEFQVSQVIRAAATAIFILGPAALFYETQSYYEYFVVTELAVAALLFVLYFRTHKKSWLYAFFGMAGLIVLTRTAFHLIWLLPVVTIVLVFDWKNRKKVLLAFAIPFVVCFAWYAKNYFVFGQFTASTWAGMNMARISTYALSRPLRDPLIASGQLSPLADLTSVFDYPLDKHQDLPQTGIPALDEVYKTPRNLNYNNINVIPFSNQLMKDALVSIRTYPKQYLYSVFTATIFYFTPSSFFYESKNTPQPLLDWENVDRSLFFSRLVPLDGHWGSDPNGMIRTAARVLTYVNLMWLGYGLAFLLGGIYSLRALFGKAKTAPNAAGIVFLVFNLVFISIVSNVAELQMNYRFRFMADPYFVLLAAVGVNWLWGKAKTINHR